MNKLAPVTLFVYNRLWHTQMTINSLLRNSLASESDLIVFSDGAKSESDSKLVQEVRAYLKNVDGFKSIKIFESATNKGLAVSIIDGVTKVLLGADKIIVLEDDMVTSPLFLRYMNNSLDMYENDQEVISIHGYVYPTNESIPDYFFLKGADCWGWATWRRGWELFESDGKKLFDELTKRDLLDEFDFGGTYPYTRMLKKQIAGKNNSWAIRWYASAFLHEKLTLYPGKSYVQNIGNDASGTHSRTTHQFAVDRLNTHLPSGKMEIKEDVRARKIVSAYFQSIAKNPIQKFFDSLMFLLRR